MSDLDLQTIRDFLRKRKTDTTDSDPEVDQPESSTTLDQAELQDKSEKPIPSLHRRRLSRLGVPSPDPPKADTSETDSLFTLSPTIYVPPTSPLPATASEEDSSYTLQPTVYEGFGFTLQPTVYEGSGFTLSPTCYQAPPRSEFGPLPVTSRDLPPPPPPRVKESRQSLYNPAADRVPRAYPKPSPITLNKDGKRTTPPWKSPNFPDLTCGHRTVIPLAYFEQEERLIKRLETAKAQEATDKKSEETSRKRLATAEEEEDIPQEKEVTSEGREGTSTAEKESAKEQTDSPQAQKETSIERSIQRLTTTEPEEEEESLEEEEQKNPPEEEEDEESPDKEEDEESPKEEEDEESPDEEEDQESPEEEEEEESPDEEEDEESPDEEEDEESPDEEEDEESPDEEEDEESPDEEEDEESPDEEEDEESPDEEEDEESPDEEEDEESPDEEEDEESPDEEEDEESPDEEEDEESPEEEEDEESPENEEDESPEEDEKENPEDEDEKKSPEGGEEEQTREKKPETLTAQSEGAKDQAEGSEVQEQTSEYHYIAPKAFDKMAGNAKVPQPGPAKLGKNSDLDQWLDCAKKCQYLPEAIMKKLCEMVKELLMEESNVQPVSTPVTICGDIHGQFYDLLELFRVGGGMPDDTQIDAPTVATRIITSDDIEPPTEITDPKLKRKMKKSISSSSGGESSNVSSEVSDDDDDEEGRGRSRGIEAELGMKKGNQEGLPGNQNYIFLGDFVDRGYFSLETFTLLMCLKAKFSDRITLVRGNHESRQITQVYGFYEECQQKYGNASVWKACCQVFDFLILAAVIDGKVLCVHGGLSPEIRTLDQIRVVARAQEIPHEGAFCDLVWSDPEDVETWAVSPRGAGWLFGDKVASEFNHVNGLQLIARAHQLVNEGFKWHFRDKSVVTVWSAPNYCYRCGNVASIMNLGEDLNPKFTIFSAVPDEQRAVPGATGRRADYFL